MNVLPGLLYLFSSLSIEVSSKQFREWNMHISRFIWNNKRPRVRFSTLQLPREKGGMALPSLKDYYISAQLRPLIYWCNPSYKAKWKTIEFSLIDIPIQSLLGRIADKQGIPQTDGKWVNFSLKMWLEVVQRFQLQEEVKLLKWPAYDPDYKPALYDFRYRQWVFAGLTSLCLIVESWTLDSFDHLCQTYGLSKQDFFR